MHNLMTTISQTSYFRSPPTNLTPEQVLVFNGIRYSLDICDLCYDRMKKNLFDLSYSEANQIPSFPSIFSDVWSIINNATIFYNIVTRHFDIKKNDLIFEKIQGIEFLRHSNQHIDERIDEILLERELPIYGSLSWYAQLEPNSPEGKIMMINSGTITHRKSTKTDCTNPSDKINDEKINDIKLSMVVKINKSTFERKIINLNELMKGLGSIIEFFEKQMKRQLEEYEPLERHISDLIITLYVKKS